LTFYLSPSLIWLMGKIKSQHRICGKLKARLAGVRAIALTGSGEKVSAGRDPLDSLHHVPAGALVIVRDYHAADRFAQAQAIVDAAKTRGWLVAVAGDAKLARAVGADGLHLPGHMLARPPYGLPILSAACHTRMALKRAVDFAVPCALVSPVFATTSHPGTPPLGVHRLARLITGAHQDQRIFAKIFALGGIDVVGLKRLRPISQITGFAAISGWRSSNLDTYWR